MTIITHYFRTIITHMLHTAVITSTFRNNPKKG